MNYYLYTKESGMAKIIKNKFISFAMLLQVQQITQPAIGIVHEIVFMRDTRRKELTKLLAKCKLIIFFTENYSRPEIHNSAPVNGPICWKSHPQYIVKSFDRLISMLENNDPENWDVNKWVFPWPEHLASAYLLQVTTKNANSLDIGKLEISPDLKSDDFWNKVLEEFQEQKKQINDTDITKLKSFSLDKGCEELGKLLKKIAEAKVL